MKSEPNDFEEVYRAGYDKDQLPMCCGVNEMGGFELDDRLRYYLSGWEKNERFDRLEEGWFKTPREAWIKTLEEMRDDSRGRPFVINLVVKDDATKELRTLLNEQKDAYIVHTWKNPGSGNVLEMYVLTNGSKK